METREDLSVLRRFLSLCVQRLRVKFVVFFRVSGACAIFFQCVRKGELAVVVVRQNLERNISQKRFKNNSINTSVQENFPYKRFRYLIHTAQRDS